MPLFDPLSQNAASDSRSSAGDIKSKVLEAFARGNAVIGNAATFEAIPLVNYPLQIENEAGLLTVGRDPEAHRAWLEEAACVGARYSADYYDPAVFFASWNQVLKGKFASFTHDDDKLYSWSTSAAAENGK
jgi:hypothetical protein